MYLVTDQLRAPGNRPGNLNGTLNSDVITNVTAPAPCTPTTPCPTIFNDVGVVTMHIDPKDLLMSPTPSNAVTITRYHVTYIRADGRNIPGQDVPYGFDGAMTFNITQAGIAGTGTMSFELVRHIAKQEAPLVQLQLSSTIITTIAQITFFGKDAVGNDVSVTGTMQIDLQLRGRLTSSHAEQPAPPTVGLNLGAALTAPAMSPHGFRCSSRLTGPSEYAPRALTATPDSLARMARRSLRFWLLRDANGRPVPAVRSG